jgi:hypothetical protein
MSTETELPLPPKTNILAEERTRLAGEIFKKTPYMAAEFKVLIKHTSGLLQQSMVHAYTKALNDAVKLILKENKNEK